MITLLNSPRLTDFGNYQYRPATLEEVRSLVGEGFQSAIGHKSTAHVLSALLGVEVVSHRMNYRQKPGEQAIVFELIRRPPEGADLDSQDIINIGYRFGILTRID